MSRPWRSAWARHPLAVAGAAVLVLWALAAALAPWIAPFDPLDQPDIVNGKLLAPNAQHWLGTDALSRDIFSRILFGARMSLIAGFLAMSVAVGIGVAVGAVAGYCGGKVDALLMRLVDFLLCIPQLIVLLVVLGLLPGERSLLAVSLVLGFSSWMAMSRLVRAEVLSLKEREFALAARALGLSRFRVLWRHLLPHCSGVILVSAGLSLGSAVLWESSLAFLGLGPAAPAPTWGSMIAEGLANLASHPWVALAPGVAVTLAVLAANSLVHGLRKAGASSDSTT